MTPATKNAMVNVQQLISQLLNGKVVVQKLPEIRGHLRLVTNNVLESNDNSKENDEFFFQDPGRKQASKVSKPFCSSCKITIENFKPKDKNCQTCGSVLLFKCMTCSTQYTTYRGMQSHLRVQCDRIAPSIRCSQCDYVTASKIALSRHKHFVHIASIKCSKCDKNFQHFYNLKKHKKYCKESKSENMPHDKKTLKSVKKKVDSNTIAKSNKNIGYSVTWTKNNSESKNIQLCCLKCKKITHSKFANSMKSCRKCSNLLYLRCKKCKKQYLCHESMKYHLQSKCSPDATYQCSQCDYVTTVQGSIVKHIKNKHNASTNLLRCTKCGIKLKNALTKRSHENYCGKEPNKNKHNASTNLLQCTKCGIKLKNALTKRSHEYYCGKEPNIFCALCPYKTKVKTNMRAHLKFHHSKVNYDDMNNFIIQKVVENDKETRKKVISIVENQADSTTVKACCSNCKKEKDITEHPGKKCPVCRESLHFKCKKCGKLCNNYFNATSHVTSCKLHQNANHTKCEKCNKKFLNFSKLRMHISKCQAEFLRCRYCKYASKYKQNLVHHMLRLHGVPRIEANAAINSEKIEEVKKVKKVAKVPTFNTKRVRVIEKREGKAMTVREFSRKICPKCKATTKGEIQQSFCSRCNSAQMLHQCKKCKAVYERANSLIHHCKSHCYAVMQYTCKKCSYSTGIKTLILRHVMYVHPTDKNPLSCTRCGKMLKNDRSMKTHLSTCRVRC